MSQVSSKSVTIVGAGLSGLICGMKLSKAGFDVNIVEELTFPGGLLASGRIGREYLELLPHHLRKTDKALMSIIKELGMSAHVEWFDSLWYGRASHKKVGYFRNGFASLINMLIQDIIDNGGRITYSASVNDIRYCDGRYTTTCVLNDLGRIQFVSDYVIFAGSCRSFINASHNLPLSMNVRDQLMNITYNSSISILMTLRKCPSEVYLYRLPAGKSFNRIVNHSNCFGVREYGGNVIYLVGEISVSDPLWVAPDEDIMDTYFKAFRKMYPQITKADVKSWRLTRNRYAVTNHYPDTDLTSPMDGLFICTSALSRFKTDEIPENRMDLVAELASRITSSIIELSTNTDLEKKNEKEQPETDRK